MKPGLSQSTSDGIAKMGENVRFDEISTEDTKLDRHVSESKKVEMGPEESERFVLSEKRRNDTSHGKSKLILWQFIPVAACRLELFKTKYPKMFSQSLKN